MDSDLSPLGAFVFLVFGVIIQALLRRFVYPVLSNFHERAKAAGRLTTPPARIMLIMRLVNFIVLPAIGLLTGGQLFNR